MFYKFHGASILIYNEGKLLILKRADSDKADANLWTIPGGGIEEGEDLEAAIKREVLEETGIVLDSLNLKDLQGFIFEDFDENNKLTIGVLSTTIKTLKILLNNEHSDYKWIDISEIDNYELGRVLRSVKALLA